MLATNPQSVSVGQRVVLHEFNDGWLTVSHSKLFCTACHEQLSLKNNVIANHMQSATHKVGKCRLTSKEAKERDFALSLATIDQQCHPFGETLPIEQRVYCIKVT